MNDFDWDALQKKRVARSATHMRRGSKSKKCSLPSDHMTSAEWKRRNGPVITYNLNNPMSWETFKSMPLDMQQQYISGLFSRFGVSTQVISEELFKCSRTTLCAHIKAQGLAKPPRNLMDTAQRLAWEAWLCPQTESPPREVLDEPGAEDIGNVEPETALWEAPVAPKGFQLEPRAEGLRISNLSATFTGEFEPAKFMKWLSMPPMPEGKVRINVEVSGE